MDRLAGGDDRLRRTAVAAADNRVVRGLAWGVLSGFSFALLAVSNRALAARRAPTAIAFWQNVCAAACLLPA